MSHAVITGDLVNSTQLGGKDYAYAMELVEGVIARARTEFGGSGETFQGDAFQLYIPGAFGAMTLALSLRLALSSDSGLSQAIGVTLSLGIGEVDRQAARPGRSLGSAYTLSGRELKNTPRGSLSLHFDNQAHNQRWQLCTAFLDNLLNGLTRKQSAVLREYIRSDFADHQHIAERLGSSRQNITAHLKRAGAELVSRYLTEFEHQWNGD